MASPKAEEAVAAEVEAEATGSVAVAAAAAAAATSDDGGEQGHSGKKVRLPDPYVAAILSLKREPPPSAQYLEVLSPEKELEYTGHCKELEDELEAFEKDGYFVVDESYLEETAACLAMANEQLAKLDFSGIVFGDWDYDDLD
ncbi:Os05g0360100 [Oryza sativa Japonica Group]|jgi:hypothetical protein|uniref:Uncharacterized protein n=2 Tax=Oryza sativa subsp. japonica TaxID=39947 RepID=B9FH96_ORYSJ|nr:hypothetical protein [Oryza sativa Japonica Group]EEE63411.1 hypothetical protein OsJ_18223 [Oryza sativa Japonica Group]BAS93602.1 Os05g0360100 [Oryza sativa Japonica Group]